MLKNSSLVNGVKPARFKKLLAKSLRQRKPKDKERQKERKAAYYTGHIALVMQSADILLQEIGQTILAQLKLKIPLIHFVKTVRLGVYLHDWGKANQHFQEMVYLASESLKSPEFSSYYQEIKTSWDSHNGKQMIRHELLSGILALRVPTFREWLEQCADADLIVAVWAAIGHHLKVSPDKDITKVEPATGKELKILTQHRDFKTLLKMGTARGLDLPNTLPVCPQEVWSKDEIEQALVNLRKEFIEFEKRIGKDSDYQRFIAAVKATVIAADIAASAIPSTQYSLKGWMQQVLDQVLSKDEIQELLKQRLGNNKLRDFQRQIADSRCRVTLVHAGCGTGKTVAAYAWANRWACGHKLFFGYPTTGTASQGFLDYVAETDIEKTLIHSRSDIDLEIYRTLFYDKSDFAENIDARLEAFKAWGVKLIVCTVDSVLGLIQNNRKPLYSWTAIAQSAFVFDEVHSYGDRLFGALLRFLKTFRGAPILLMSASFSKGQLEAIYKVMDELGEEINCIEGPRELEELRRYQVKFVSDTSEVWSSVIEALKKGQKVLWVTNSVKECIGVYRKAKEKIAQEVPELSVKNLIYHSRYRYKDRLEQHQKVIEAFDSKQLDPVLAITTQVCEMSLDLSANLLVSALAPPGAIIQRLGRLNRFVRIDEYGKLVLASGGSCCAIFYPWTSNKPYPSEDLLAGQKFLEQLILKKNDISQHDLSEIAEQIDSRTYETVKSTWLDDHWCASIDYLRDEGYTVTVLLQEDIKLIKDAANQRSDKSFMKEAQRWSVPIRIPPDLSSWKRVKKIYLIAPNSQVTYSPETGAEELW